MVATRHDMPTPPAPPGPIKLSIELDTELLDREIGWLSDRLLERFPQGLGERIRHLDGFFSGLGNELVQLDDVATCDAGRLVLRLGLRGRAELLATALAALESDGGDGAGLSVSHGVPR